MKGIRRRGSTVDGSSIEKVKLVERGLLLRELLLRELLFETVLANSSFLRGVLSRSEFGGCDKDLILVDLPLSPSN